MGDELQIERVTDEQLPEVIALCARSLNWPADPRNEQLFRWKHVQNPFGRSAMWSARHQGRMVGFRSMMRWRFAHPDGTEVTAVRAVDTATAPDYRGRGIFSKLTLHAVDELTAEGVAFVFNTPNAMSRPGYLKLGWVDAGRVPIALRPRGLGGLMRMFSANTAANKWSEPLTIGAAEISPAQVLAVSTRQGAITTALTPDFLKWRFQAGPVSYRSVSFGRAGVVVRARRRGEALELAIVLAWGDPREVREGLGPMLRDSGCSYAVATPTTPGCDGLIPAPSMGPHLTLRPLARQPPSAERFAFMLGDIELF